jgi:hypothetical protein
MHVSQQYMIFFKEREKNNMTHDRIGGGENENRTFQRLKKVAAKALSTNSTHSGIPFHSHMNRESEEFSLFWLDEGVNNDENQRIQKELQPIVDRLRTFTDLSMCEQCIQSLAQDKRCVLVVSGRLGLRMVPQIHHLQQVPAIYVYCMNKESNEQWALQYPKVGRSLIKFCQRLSLSFCSR